MTKNTKPAGRKAAKLCPGCNGDFSAPGITPSSKTPGMCADCAPAHTTHLVLAGTYDTFCGKPTYQINADPGADAKVYDALFGSNYVNCTACMSALSRKRNR